MTSHNRRYNFKYPKPLVESSNNSRLLSPRRPQPSPSKRELMMQELGFADLDNVTSESSESSDISDDDTLSTVAGLTKAEYDILQRERDNLLFKNKELDNELRLCKGQLHREETKRSRHVKILKKAQNELLKDKNQLITNLEDIVFECEHKIKQLEDDLKGNPIRPTVDGSAQVSNIQKLVDNIKSLHDEKSVMREQLINLEQELDEKTSEMLDLKENQTMNGNFIIKDNQKTDNEKVVEKLKKSISELESALKDKNHELIVEIDKTELSHNKIEKLEKTVRKLEDDKKKIEKKTWMEIEVLRKDLETKNEKIYDLENKPPEIVTKMIEKVVEVESSEQKSEIGEAKNKITQLENFRNDAEQSLQKARNEVTRLRDQLSKYQLEMSQLKSDANEASSQYLDEQSKLQDEIRRIEAELSSEKKSHDKLKKSVTKEKEKFVNLEQEMQELKASSRKNRDENMFEIEALKKKMLQQKDDLTKELDEGNDAAEKQKQEFDKDVERLESKVLRTEEKLKKSKHTIQELNTKLNEKSSKIESLSNDLETKEDSVTSLQTELHEINSVLKKEQQQLFSVQQKLVSANDMSENLQSQINDLSGASDVAIVELSTLKSDKSKLEHRLKQMNDIVSEYERKLKDADDKEEQMKQQCYKLDQEIANERRETQRKLNELQENHDSVLNDIKSSASNDLHNVSTKLYKVQCSLRHLLSTVHILVKENNHIKKECSKFPLIIEEVMRHTERKIGDAIAEISENSKELIRRYKKEMNLRKKYHNELVELKGNIRVFVRVRPTISEDGSGNQAKNAVTYDHDDDGMIFVHNSQRGRSQLFELDKVFQPTSTQPEVYSEVRSLVTSCIDGYHICIFAYGQTGSGKTYTMEGPTSDPGINQRALSDLFQDIEERRGEWKFEVSVSLVEIYNETLKDLLNLKPTTEKLEIKMNGDGGLYVPGLTCKKVKNIDDVNALFKLGHTNRKTASTNMNEHSSRSHAVLMVYVEGTNETTAVRSFGKLNLIDLAGSERVSKSGASGDRLKEAQNINKSLSALGDVIHALGGRQAHVPFRNSKLTYLLQDSLSKDSKTLMVVQVAPVEKNVSETLCSLSFAQRVRKVELGQASKKTEEIKQDDSSSTPRKSGIPSSKTGQQSRKKF
uniref:kinesin-like protein KIFC3 n=1 Tax=Styela clava TaxID=7725 RepID=UPI0019399B0F|nr:kinesin-like protein KIFC3 [Styela clava]